MRKNEMYRQFLIRTHENNAQRAVDQDKVERQTELAEVMTCFIRRNDMNE